MVKLSETPWTGAATWERKSIGRKSQGVQRDEQEGRLSGK